MDELFLGIVTDVIIGKMMTIENVLPEMQGEVLTALKSKGYDGYGNPLPTNGVSE